MNLMEKYIKQSEPRIIFWQIILSRLGNYLYLQKTQHTNKHDIDTYVQLLAYLNMRDPSKMVNKDKVELVNLIKQHKEETIFGNMIEERFDQKKYNEDKIFGYIKDLSNLEKLIFFINVISGNLYMDILRHERLGLLSKDYIFYARKTLDNLQQMRQNIENDNREEISILSYNHPDVPEAGMALQISKRYYDQWVDGVYGKA